MEIFLAKIATAQMCFVSGSYVRENIAVFWKNCCDFLFFLVLNITIFQFRFVTSFLSSEYSFYFI